MMMITAQSLNSQVERLLRSSLLNTRNCRLIIAIAGVPGAGKTSLAQKVVDALNQFSESSECAIALPMDGFHYPKAVLDTFSDPAIAHARRGAQFTFDSRGYLEAVQNLIPISNTMTWPGFDHSIGDPIQDQYKITSSHRIVVIEGLYTIVNKHKDLLPTIPELLLLSHLTIQPEWSIANSLSNERWFVHVPPEIARLRLAHRHVRAGLALDLTQAYRKIDMNDAINAQWVMDHIDTSAVDFVIDNTLEI